MSKYLKYLKYVLEHKKNIFKICWRDRMYLHAFTHDLSKLSYIEFIAYAENFYGKRHCTKCKHFSRCDYNQIGLGSGNWGKQCADYEFKDFSFAWDCHVVLNKHHWQHWTYDIDAYYASDMELKFFKLEKPRPIPDKYLKQIICDWEAMGVKFNDTAQMYYLLNYNKIVMDDNSRIVLEFMLNINDSMIHNYGHTLKQFKEIYDKETFNKYFGWIHDAYGVDAYDAIEVDKNREI